jgi:hypothetical protein
VEREPLVHINASKLLTAVRRLNRLPAAFYPPNDDQLGTAAAVESTPEKNARLLMPFSFIPTGEIPDEEFDELAERVFGTVRNYEGPVEVSEIWPEVVADFESQDEFRTANENIRKYSIIKMELDPLWKLLKILFPRDLWKRDETPTSDVVFFAPQEGMDWTLFSTEMNRYPVCVEVKTDSIKNFIDYLEGTLTEEPPSYKDFCQQLLVYLITYATTCVVITDGRWYVMVEISDVPRPRTGNTVHLPIRCKTIDSFSTDVHTLTPTVLLLYCALKSMDSSAKDQELITEIR